MLNDRPSDYRFTATGSPRGDAPTHDVASIIVCEPVTDEAEAASCGSFALPVQPGTSLDEARAIARYLRAHVRGFLPPRAVRAPGLPRDGRPSAAGHGGRKGCAPRVRLKEDRLEPL